MKNKNANKFSLAIKKLTGDAGMFSASLFLAFIIFMGVMVVSGQVFNPPTQAPPGGNARPPVNTSTSTQSKFGKLALKDLFIIDLDMWLTQFRPQYHIQATTATSSGAIQQECNLTVPVDESGKTAFNAALGLLCGDSNGCEITLGAHNFDPANRPGLAILKGPVNFFVSTSTGHWQVSTGGYVGNNPGYAIGAVFGKDLNGSEEEVLHVGNCIFTDTEYTRPTSPSGECDSINSNDSLVGFGLRNTYVDVKGSGNTQAVCTLDIDD